MSDERDAAIDARLRDVPLPPGLAGRVSGAALFADAAIDALLARVDAPAGLGDRVREACRATGRGLLDAAADAAAPAAMRPARSAGGVVRRWLSAAAADLGAVAAALAIVAAMFFAGTELSRRMAAPIAAVPRLRPAPASAAPSRPPLPVEGSLQAARPVPPGDSGPGPAPRSSRSADRNAVVASVPRGAAGLPGTGEPQPDRPLPQLAAAGADAVAGSPAAFAYAAA